MDNKYTAEVSITMGDKEHTIVFDWAALSTLKSAFTDKQLDGVISGQDIEIMGEVMAIGLQRHHKGITAQEVVDLSPPLVIAVEALDKALTFAYYGKDGAPVENGARAQKKTRKKK